MAGTREDRVVYKTPLGRIVMPRDRGRRNTAAVTTVERTVRKGAVAKRKLPHEIPLPPKTLTSDSKEPLRDIDGILARIDALFACLQHISPEKQRLYVATETQHCRDPGAIAAIADRSERKAAMDYAAAVKASIEANSLAPAALEPLAAEIQACLKYYKDFHDHMWDENRTYALNLCEKMIHVLIPITRRLKSYADETTASASGTLESIIYWIKGSLSSTQFAWDKTISEIQKKTPTSQAKPPTVDAVIASSLLFWYSPQNKHGPNYNPNRTKPAPAPPTVTQQHASLNKTHFEFMRACLERI